MPVAPPDPGAVFRDLVPVPLTGMNNCRAYPGCPRGARRPHPAGSAGPPGHGDRGAERDTIVQCAPGGGVTARGWVRSAVVSDARDPSPSGRAGTPRTGAARPAARHGERPPLLPTSLQAPCRVHADLRVPRDSTAGSPAGRVRRTPLPPPVLGARLSAVFFTAATWSVGSRSNRSRRRPMTWKRWPTRCVRPPCRQPVSRSARTHRSGQGRGHLRVLRSSPDSGDRLS